jgi:hypothetical protein
MEEQKKDILDIIDDGIREAYRRFRIEESERNKVVSNENEKNLDKNSKLWKQKVNIF